MAKTKDEQICNEFYANEYQMLSNAHFETSKRITQFFQYALLIFSAPLALLTSQSIQKSLLGIVFAFIGVIGFFVLLYLNQLRAESLLYARSVNTIRKNIYSELYKKNKDLNQVNQSLILLTQDKKPKYFDSSQFIFIVITLGLFDSFYLGYGIYTIIPLPGIYCQWALDNTFLISILAAALFFVIHMISFKLISNYNENGSAYFKRIIGVDIDGVLNKHEEQFVKIYNMLPNKTVELKVSDIVTMPVSKSGIIKREDEHKVFQTYEYWDSMPETEDCNVYLSQEIKNELGYKVHIFTWRDWDVSRSIAVQNINNYSIKAKTKEWLKQKNILYNKIYFEKGNIDKPIKLFDAKYKTRIYYSAKQNIKYFVEDNIYNALKLSHICKYVFLFSHTYNEKDQIELPFNIIRVTSWKEILYKIKELD